MEPENLLLDEFVLSLARSEHPRVCFVPTASGDSESYVAAFYRSFATLDCQPRDLPLFQRSTSNLESFVLAQDVIYVGGGSCGEPTRHLACPRTGRHLARSLGAGRRPLRCECRDELLV